MTTFRVHVNYTTPAGAARRYTLPAVAADAASAIIYALANPGRARVGQVRAAIAVPTTNRS